MEDAHPGKELKSQLQRINREITANTFNELLLFDLTLNSTFSQLEKVTTRPDFYLYNPKEGRHGLQIIIWWNTSEKFNHSAANTPNVRCSTNSGHFNDLQEDTVPHIEVNFLNNMETNAWK